MIEANICALVLLHCEKVIKCSASLAFYHFAPTRLINLIKYEHSCKFLYVKNSVYDTEAIFLTSHAKENGSYFRVTMEQRRKFEWNTDNFKEYGT